MKIKCPLCGFENEEGSRFCSNCNEPLVKSKAPNAIENPYIKTRKESNTNFLAPSEGDNKISTKQLLGLIGSIVLFVGVFAPIISVPIIGNMNYFQNGKGDGTIIIVLAVVSTILVLLKKFKGLWFTGLGSMALMVFTFLNFQMKISDIKAQMETELAGNPFRGITDMAMQSVQLQWGWALLIVGAALVIASAAIKDKSQ